MSKIHKETTLKWVGITCVALFFVTWGLHFGPGESHLGNCEENNSKCIASEEICDNKIDEDCSGSDSLCTDCAQENVLVSGCRCGNKSYYSGYCCGGVWQVTPCNGSIFYIDLKGDDKNDGTQYRPWRSLRYALTKVKAGDTVLINPGKYVELDQISIRTSGKKGKPITFRGNGKGVEIDLTRFSGRNGFEIHFANYVIIENLIVHASRDKLSRGIRLTHANGSVIRNNTVSGAGHANLFSSLGDHVTFEGNRAYGGSIGLYIADSSDYVTVKNNVFYNNSAIGLHMNGDKSAGGDGTISYATIENNIVYDNGGTGINCDGVTRSVFRNNLLYDNKHRGIAFFKQDGAVASNDNYVIHNTIIMPGGAYYAIGLNHGSYRNNFFNNIILTVGNVPCFSTTGKLADLEVVSDYNLFTVDGNIWDIAGSAYRFGILQRKLSEIFHKASNLFTKRGISNDRHSVQAEIGKIFTNHTNGDFQLKATSPAIDNGISTHSFGKDLIGNLRPSGCCPDLGAFEYAGRRSHKIVGNQGGAPEVNSELLTSKTKKINRIVKIEPVEKKIIRNKLGMEFALIPPGSFRMGTVPPEEEKEFFSTLHQVELTKGFYMQVTEVTQRQWKELMGTNPSFFKNCGDECPVEQVSWDKAQEFIKRLNQAEGTHKYRLPTEAEWEYACRAGTKTPFSFGKCLTTEQANYNGNYPFVSCQKGLYMEKPFPVGSFPSNAWGLSGMHGNVWEWCQDWLGEYPSVTVVAPSGPPSGSLRVIRGGGWNSYARACRSGNRSGNETTKRFANLGFRVVRDR